MKRKVATTKTKSMQSNNEAEGWRTALAGFKIYHKAAKIKTAQCWLKEWTKKWERKESPATSPRKYNQGVLDKGEDNTGARESSLFKKDCCNYWTSPCQTRKNVGKQSGTTG